MFPRCLLPALLLTFGIVARADEDPTTFEVGSLKFTRPADWKWVPVTSPMRIAQLRLPGAGGAMPADITFFYFGETGAGGVDANVKRWVAQFSGPPESEKIETQTMGETKVTLVSKEGTFVSGMMGGQPSPPQENYALLGAIIDARDGLVFAKMTGPITTVKAMREPFLAFLKTALPEKK